MKFEKDGIVIEVTDPNTFNIFKREGFKEVEETEDEELLTLRAKAKELGIKGYATSKAETLITKIAEIENK
jgi:hypothetical protein